MPRIVRPGGRQHRLELDAAPDGQAHSQPTDQPPSPLTHAGAASSQQSPQSSVSGREPTAHCASYDPPCASDLAASSLTPKLLATRPSFVTRYRPPRPTHGTRPTPTHPPNHPPQLPPLHTPPYQPIEILTPRPHRLAPQPLNPTHQPALLLRQPRYRNQRTNRK